MLLIASLVLFLISLYYFAEALTSTCLYDICWYGAKSVFVLLIGMICLSYAVGG